MEANDSIGTPQVACIDHQAYQAYIRETLVHDGYEVIAEQFQRQQNYSIHFT